jgi:hypothetical protein
MMTRGKKSKQLDDKARNAASRQRKRRATGTLFVSFCFTWRLLTPFCRSLCFPLCQFSSSLQQKLNKIFI